MGFLLSQLGLLAQRGRDTNEWVNVLFVVVVAVLYAVGALIKGAGAKAQKREGQGQPAQRQRETWLQRLARKAEEMQRPGLRLRPHRLRRARSPRGPDGVARAFWCTSRVRRNPRQRGSNVRPTCAAPVSPQPNRSAPGSFNQPPGPSGPKNQPQLSPSQNPSTTWNSSPRLSRPY